MADYSSFIALADRMLKKRGVQVTISMTPPAAADPVTGVGGGKGGAPALLWAVQTKLDYKAFPEGFVQDTDRMWIVFGSVPQGHYGYWPTEEGWIAGTKEISPDATAKIITKVVVRG